MALFTIGGIDYFRNDMKINILQVCRHKHQPNFSVLTELLSLSDTNVILKY